MTVEPLTANELELAVRDLIRLRANHRGPWDVEDLAVVLASHVRPVRSMLALLRAIGMIDCDDGDLWSLTNSGLEVTGSVETGQWHLLIDVALHSGLYERELLRFLGSAQIRDGMASMNMSSARSLCPTLAAVLSWNPSWRRAHVLEMPIAILQDAIIEASVNIGDRDSSVSWRDRFGIRAAAYSLRLEREVSGVSKVLYVTDDERESLGYDIENTSVDPSRLIICVGSALAEMSESVLSGLEFEFEDSRYELQYWGLVDLLRRPKAEYLSLRRLGYPRVIDNFPGSAADASASLA